METSRQPLTDANAIIRILQQRFERICEVPDQLVVPSHPDRFNPSYRGRFHINPELFLPQTGRTCFECPDHPFLLGPGQMCIVPTGVSHHERVHSGEIDFFTLVFGFSRVTKKLLLFQCTDQPSTHRVFSFHTTAYPLEEFDVCLQLIDGASTAFLRQQSYWRPMLETALVMMSDALHHPETFTHQQSPLVERVIQQISNHLSEPSLSVQSLAEQFHLSAGHLSRVFRTQMGTTLQEYLLTQRLNVAKHLLRAGTLDVNEVAYACGYKYPSYFVRFFKQKTGRTPGEWRTSPSRRGAV